MLKNLVTPALEELFKAAEADPENADVHYLTALVYLRQGVEALDMGERVQCLKGVARDEQRQRATRHFTAAKKELIRAVQCRPTFSDALNALAVVEMHLGEHDAAIAHVRAALANVLYREPFAGLGNLGWAYYQKRDLNHAASELRQAVTQQPRFCVGRYRLGQVYFDQNNWEAALAELEQVAQDSSCPIQEAYYLLGLTYAKLSRGQEKIAQAFQTCERLAPRSCLAEECRRYARLVH